MVMDAVILLSLFLSATSSVISIYCAIEVKAMQKSTHQVTFVDPAKQMFENLTEDTKKVLEKEDFDSIM